MEGSNPTGQTFNPFTSNTNKYVNSGSSTRDFLNSNSLVAKIAFLLLVLVVFVILLRIGISILGYFLSPSGTPN
jgi:hypothetical protein